MKSKIPQYVTVKHFDAFVSKLDKKLDVSVERLDQKIDGSVERLDQKIDDKFDKLGAYMVTHFYTKGEIDRKFFEFGQKMDRGFQKVDQQFKDQMHQIKILFESVKSDNIGILHDKNKSQDEKIEDHEKRITHLEKEF
ncbi:MAG: hypothetical protein HY390_06780 [Deltaproteobacteria bacterium]|nr:hypothetical protein [Deltaproteobacteria bacterium]